MAKSMKKTAVICNSLNPDLVKYFEIKVKSSRDKAAFYAAYDTAARNNLPVSSFSKSSSLSWLFLVDAFFSVYVFLKLVFSNYRRVIFDTAHISNLPLALLCKLIGIELIFTIHDWNPHPGSQSGAVKLYNGFVKKFLASSFVVFSHVKTKKTCHTLRLSGFSEGVCAPNKNYFLFFGRIEPYKGLSHLSKIFELYRNNYDSTSKLYVVGKGDDAALSVLSEQDGVVVKNEFIPCLELEKMISECIAVLVPYDSATQSGVVIQSYAHGKPVVAHSVGALPEYIEDSVNGFLVDKGNHDLFCQSMLKLKNSDGIEHKVKEIFKEKYSDEACKKQWLELLSSLD